jgi:hypothetical protein
VSRNARTRIKNISSASRLSNFCIFFVWRDPNHFLSQFVTRTKTGYITMTRRQSNNQWSGGMAGHPAQSQKISSTKTRWKISSLDFLGSRRHPPHRLSSKEPNYQRGVLLISAGAIEGHFEGKTPQEDHRALATQKKLAYLGFQYLNRPPYFPDLAPSAYHLLPGL